MKKIKIRDELDFVYLLELMPPLHNIEEYSLLPELFSIIGYESLLKLCKYAGGETIKVPTLDELYLSLQSLQYFYDVYIKKSKSYQEIPKKFLPFVDKIREVYRDAR